MAKFKDLTGKKFNRLTAIKRMPNGKGGKTRWLCECDCKDKTQVIVDSYALTHNHTKSCGCLQKEIVSYISKKQNIMDLDSYEYGVGYTSKGEEFYFDLEDYDKIKDYCWYIDGGTKYVRTRLSDGKQVSMHRLLFPNTIEVDHINHMRHDNRKNNLRPCTRQENNMNKGLQSNNTSGVVGVYWSKKRNKWIAQIKKNGKIKYLGGFNKFENAVEARKEAEEKYFGEFSYDNSQQLCKEFNLGG